MKKLISLIMSAALILSSAIIVFAANPVPATDEWLQDWDSRASSSGKIWQSPGEDENDRVFTWISENLNNTFTYSDGDSTVEAKVNSKLSVYGIINTVKLIDLEDKSYTFSYTADGVTYEGNSFTVSSDSYGFTAAFCSDPQLGRSGDDSLEAVQNDTYGWERTVKAATEGGAELILSAGDQINDGFSTLQYNAFFSAEALSTVPLAPTAGNHDFYSPIFSTYFGNSGVNTSGNDYYFSYGDALFIVLDSNNVIPSVHKDTFNRAVSAFPEARWRVVMLHHGAYSAGADEFTNKVCTSAIKGYFDEYDIDLVLSGHNHFYSRTYPVYDGEISASGSVYFEAGSASGSKCGSYDYVSPEYIVHSEQLSEASYSLLTFTEDTIEVSSYLTDSGEMFDSFTVVRTEKSDKIPDLGLFARIIDFFNTLIEKLTSLI